MNQTKTLEKISYLKLGLGTTDEDGGALPESDNENMDIGGNEVSNGNEMSESGGTTKPTKMKINDFLA